MFYQPFSSGQVAGDNILNDAFGLTPSFSDIHSEQSGVQITENFFS